MGCVEALIMRIRHFAAALAACAASAAPAAAQGTLSEGGWTSETVQWLAHYEDTAGVAEGGRLVGTTFFLTVNNQGLLSFDVSDPEKPVLQGRLLLPHGAENEDIATNGRIALLSQFGDVYHLSDGATGAGSSVHVIDVRDPADMKTLATVPGAGDHTWDCLFDCTWAYSASGLILDLRDPSAPKLLDDRWRKAFGDDGLSPGFAHDVTEVAPGWVMVATTPMTLLDARDPANPKIVAQADPDNSPNSHHNIVWPRQMADRFVVTASEGQHMGRCEAYDGNSAALQVWDASQFARTKTWTPMGSYKPSNGTFADGDPPASATWYGCSAHWAEIHPQWHDGGLVGGAFYSHGAKIFSVGDDGELKMAGWFLAHGAGASAVYWITDRVLYVADDTRGLDVIKYVGEIPERAPVTTPPPTAAPVSRTAPLVDRRAPALRVSVRKLRRGRMSVSVRCSEDCWARVSGKRFSLRAGATRRVVLRRARTVRVEASDRAGNRTVVRRKVR
jgi:hypothetical protein